MCIRDRTRAFNELMKLEMSFYQLKETKGFAIISQNKYDSCLLYTSDAADERSSVDLGGRRIIKKKNK